MTGPMDEGGGGPAVTTFEELEALSAPAAPNLDPSTVKLEGDAIPEPLRGKSLSDVLALQAEQQRALEASRAQIDSLRALAEARTPQQPVPSVPQQPAPEAELSQAQLKEMYERDPFEYQQYMFTQMDKKIKTQVTSSVAPLASTTAFAAETQAKQKFAEEFEVLGNEINQTLQQIPDRSVLAQPGAWDQILYYVRGQHMDKLIQARTAKANAAALEEARKREANGVGSVNDGTRRGGARQRLTELTPEQKEVCRVMQLSEDDYRKYYIG